MVNGCLMYGVTCDYQDFYNIVCKIRPSFFIKKKIYSYENFLQFMQNEDDSEYEECDLHEIFDKINVKLPAGKFRYNSACCSNNKKDDDYDDDDLFFGWVSRGLISYSFSMEIDLLSVDDKNQIDDMISKYFSKKKVAKYYIAGYDCESCT